VNYDLLSRAEREELYDCQRAAEEAAEAGPCCECCGSTRESVAFDALRLAITHPICCEVEL
jgi:hypothetical protein